MSLHFAVGSLYLHQLGTVACICKGRHDLIFMFGSKCFHGDPKLYGSIAVDADKLVVLQLDDISMLLCQQIRYPRQLAGLIRQKDGYGKYPVSLNQSVLYDGG